MPRKRARVSQTEIERGLRAWVNSGQEKAPQVEFRPEGTVVIAPFTPSPKSAPAEADRDGSEIIL